PRELEQTRQAARLGEELGFSWLGVADSPTVYEDCYLHLLEAARATTSIAVGPVVSHVVARHPVIVANALATLNEFTEGRVLAVLGTGNSAARGLKLEPASVDLLRPGGGGRPRRRDGEPGDARRCPRAGSSFGLARRRPRDVVALRLRLPRRRHAPSQSRPRLGPACRLPDGHDLRVGRLGAVGGAA